MTNPWQLIFVQLFTDEDDFTQILRKITIFAAFLCSPGALAGGLYWLTIGVLGDGGAGVGVVIAGVVAILTFIFILSGYIAARRARFVNDTLMTMLTWSILPLCFAMTFCLTGFDSRLLLMCLAVVTILSESTHWVLQVVCCIVIQLASAYNDAFMTPNREYFVLLVPGADREKTHLEILGERLVAVAVGIVVLGAVHLQTAKNKKQMKAARSAIHMSQLVVDLLRKYDTEGVVQALEHHAKSDVDPQLLDSFNAMNANLERYKPFLPNYLFQQADDDARDSTSDDEGEISMNAESPAKLMARSISDTSEGPISPGSRQTTGRKDSDVENSLKSPNSDMDILEGTDPSVSDERHNSAVGSSGIDGPAPMSLERKRMRSLSEIAVSAAFKRITYAIVDYRHLYDTAGSPKTNAAVDVSMSVFVDIIFKAAEATKASIHGLVGDLVQVSWNATSKVSQSECKAAKFLAKVMKEAGDNEISVAGAAATGKAQCNSLVSSTKQQAQLIHSQWMGCLLGCLDLARRHRTFIIDASTHLNAHYEVECRAIDSMKWVPWATWHATTGYELLCDGPASMHKIPPKDKDINMQQCMIYEVVREVTQADDEWMYQLQKQEQGTPNTSVCKAFEFAQSGRVAEALDLLEKLEDRSVLAAPLVKRLVAFCEQKLRGS